MNSESEFSKEKYFAFFCEAVRFMVSVFHSHFLLPEQLAIGLPEPYSSGTVSCAAASDTPVIIRVTTGRYLLG